MSFINSALLVGELTEDVVFSGSGNTRTARFKMKTGRPYINSSGQSNWEYVEHSVICYKNEAFSMLEKHGKKGRWVKINGEIGVDSQKKTVLLVRKSSGDIGMMWSVLGSQEEKDEPKQNNSQKDDIYAKSDNSFLGGFSGSTSGNFIADDDEIPF